MSTPTHGNKGPLNHYATVSGLLDSFSSPNSSDTGKDNAAQSRRAVLLESNDSEKVGLPYLEIPTLKSTFLSDHDAQADTLETKEASQKRTSRERALERLSTIIKNDRAQSSKDINAA